MEEFRYKILSLMTTECLVKGVWWAGLKNEHGKFYVCGYGTTEEEAMEDCWDTFMEDDNEQH